MAGLEIGDTGQKGGNQPITGTNNGGGNNSGGGTTPPPPPPKPVTYKMGTYGAFALALFHALGVKSPTTAQMDFLLSWMHKESGQGKNNPLGIHGGAVDIATFNEGVVETAQYLRMGQYAGIFTELHKASPTFTQATSNSLLTWSGNGYSTFGLLTDSTKQGQSSLGTIVTGGTTQPGSGTTGGTTITIGGQTITLGGGTKSKTWQDYAEFLRQLGVAINPQTIGFAHFGAANQLTQAGFEYAMYHEPWFQAQFPGIFDAQGHLKMQPSQYEGEFLRYQAIASQFGSALTRDQFGYALTHNIDATTFGNRVHAEQIINTNEADFDQFEQTLQARGLIKGKLTKQDMRNFVLGKAPAIWNKVWEEGYLRIAAANAGLSVGGNITRRSILDLVKQHPELYSEIQGGGSAAIQGKFYQLAQDLRTTAPASRLYGVGLTEKDLQQLEFGGPQAANIAVRAQQALDNLKASSTPQAQNVTTALNKNPTPGVTSTYAAP